MVNTVFKCQIAGIKHNKVTFLLIVFTALIVLYTGYIHATMQQAIAYLSAMFLCAICIDLFTLMRPVKNDFPVRNPQRESVYFLITVILGMVFFYFRFSGFVSWEHLNPWVRLAVMPFLIFVFPIGLAIIMLLLRYKPVDLGFRLHGLVLALPIIAICAITSRLVSPESLTWNAILQEEGGIIGLVLSGLITSGLSEEFFRVTGQTRLGAWLKQNGLGWYIATVIWAFMHAPKWYAEGHDLAEAVLGSIRIIPIGLMWGYLTYRTKSILPATIVHGANFWGLQNF